uniref:Uncharacterized protein n=1 Tax=Phenylobacterium glaciei TaxID=2803784 RepID=A0A974P5Y3_9CAUL|nr:hypothetical protein JKL49_11755 [Phenylobacterium glaciei]
MAEALRRMADAAPDAGARAERLARAQTLSKRTVIYAFETALLSPRLGPTQPSPKS